MCSSDLDLATALKAIAERTAGTHECLVHGDISPKNILAGPQGPVFLDAECAWYGDPAFDLAFCLNHLLLKCLWVPKATPRFLACFDALVATYAPDAALEQRAAALLPTPTARIVFWDEAEAERSARRLLDTVSLVFPGHDRPFRNAGPGFDYLYPQSIALRNPPRDTDGTLRAEIDEGAVAFVSLVQPTAKRKA